MKKHKKYFKKLLTIGMFFDKIHILTMVEIESFAAIHPEPGSNSLG